MVDLHDGDEGEEDDRYHEPGHDGMHATALHGNIYITNSFGEKKTIYLQENIEYRFWFLGLQKKSSFLSGQAFTTPPPLVAWPLVETLFWWLP